MATFFAIRNSSLWRRLVQHQSIRHTFRNSSTNAATKESTYQHFEKVRPPPGQMPTLLDIGSRAIFNSDHDILRQNVRRWFQEELVPNFPKWEEQGDCGREIWQKFGSQGFLGTTVPADNGGVGGTFLDAAIISEEHAYSACRGPGFGLHSDIIMPYISKYGNQQQIDKYIPDMTAGRKISAIAMSEPGAGSDIQGIRTRAKKDGSDYIINGSKTFITNGWLADVVVVVAVTDPTAKSKAHGISLIFVEDGMPGFKKGRKLKKMGCPGQDTAELFFDDVRVPKSAILGSENKGFYYLMQELMQERLSISIISCAHSEWMFEQTRKYVTERKAFGKSLSNLQTIQHKLAEMKTEICIGRAFLDNCLDLHVRHQLDNSMASMAKYWLTDLENKVAYDCVQLHGGHGYMMETPICKAYMDARLQPIYGGTNEIMKELIAREIIVYK